MIKSSEIPLKYVTVWNGIHKTNIIREHNLKFPNCLGEDFVFSLEEFIASDSLIYLNNYFGYKYYQNETVSHATTPVIDKFYSTLKSFYLAKDIVSRNEREDIIPSLFGQQIIGLYFRIVNLNISKNEKLKLLNEISKLNKCLNSELIISSPIYCIAHKLLSRGNLSLTYLYLEFFKKLKKLLNK